MKSITQKEKYILKAILETRFRMAGYKIRYDDRWEKLRDNLFAEIATVRGYIAEDSYSPESKKNIFTRDFLLTINSLNEKGLISFQEKKNYNGTWWEKCLCISPNISLKYFHENYA